MSGIYIHVPFCKQRCSYCDFHFSTTYEKYRTTLLESMQKEISLRKAYLHKEKIQTIYFGGGTPSLLTFEEIKQLLDALYNNYDCTDLKEFTLEANPDDITKSNLKGWKELGVNRLSIGVQSFLQEDLDWMNRAHTAKESINSLKLAKQEGFSITADLIYGLPKRNTTDWKRNIHQLVALNPEHISAYCLTIEKGTALDKMIQKGELIPATEEMQAQQFQVLVKTLKANGYEQYEISNFAKNNQISIHNSNYWKGEKYLGIGPSAHSFDGKSRQWNISNNPKYIKGMKNGTPFFEKEILSKKDQFNELLLTGLRTKWGVSLKKLESTYPLTLAFKNRVSDFTKEGKLTVNDDIILLTEEGKLLADYISSELFV